MFSPSLNSLKKTEIKGTVVPNIPRLLTVEAHFFYVMNKSLVEKFGLLSG